jgi:heme/copper-type cytochrome/quinol oxidase subunit 2
MLQLVVLLHLTLLRTTTSFRARTRASTFARHSIKRDERGSVTTEHVLWAVAVIGIVGIVVAAVKAYVTSQAGSLK